MVDSDRRSVPRIYSSYQSGASMERFLNGHQPPMTTGIRGSWTDGETARPRPSCERPDRSPLFVGLSVSLEPLLDPGHRHLSRRVHRSLPGLELSSPRQECESRRAQRPGIDIDLCISTSPASLASRRSCRCIVGVRGATSSLDRPVPRRRRGVTEGCRPASSGALNLPQTTGPERTISMPDVFISQKTDAYN